MADEQKQQKDQQVDHLGARTRTGASPDEILQQDAVYLYRIIQRMRGLKAPMYCLQDSRDRMIADFKQALKQWNFALLAALPEKYDLFDLPEPEWEIHVHILQLQMQQDHLLEEARVSPKVRDAFYEALKPCYQTTVIIYETPAQGRELLCCPFGVAKAIDDLSEVCDDGAIYFVYANHVKADADEFLRSMRVIRL